MEIGQLETALEEIYEKNPNFVFPFRFSAPFSFRGGYEIVAFEVLHCTMTIERALELVELATIVPHRHYKGAMLMFDDCTNITFARSPSCGNDTLYISEQIKAIGKNYIASLEPTVENLLSLAFGL